MKKSIQKNEEIIALVKSQLPQLLLDYICDHEEDGKAAKIRQAYKEAGSAESLIVAGKTPFGVRFEENRYYTNHSWCVELSLPLNVLVRMSDLKVSLWDCRGRYSEVMPNEPIMANGELYKYAGDALLKC